MGAIGAYVMRNVTYLCNLLAPKRNSQLFAVLRVENLDPVCFLLIVVFTE
jgi:hypothetical protein